MRELYIEFDGRQLTVRTDVPEMCDFLLHEYSAMVVPQPRESLGHVDFLRSGDGYLVRGARDTDYAAPVESLFEAIKDEILFNFVIARQDLMWLHAGVVEFGGKAWLFAGPSGNGKSTLVTLLCERGWRFLSDDIAPIRMTLDEVLPFPQRPRRRVARAHVVAPESVGILERESIGIDDQLIQRTATQIGAIVFPTFRAGTPAELDKVPGGDAAIKLIRDCTNFADHRGAAVSRAVELVRAVPVYSLIYSDGPGAASLFDSLR
jgi:hypothetical protein